MLTKKQPAKKQPAKLSENTESMHFISTDVRQRNSEVKGIIWVQLSNAYSENISPLGERNNM